MDAEQQDDLRLPYLETFSKAAELSSFTAAAKALRLTQAAVSQRVQAYRNTRVLDGLGVDPEASMRYGKEAK